MEKEGIRANTIVFSTIINACANMNQMERAEQLLQYMIQRNIEANSKTYSAMVFGYANHGNFDKAWESYNSLIESGFTPDLILFSSLINAYAKYKRMDDIFDILNKMKENKIETTPLIWNTIAGGYAANGNPEDCLRVIKQNVKVHRPVTLKALNPLLKYYVENQQVADAKSLLDHMKKKYKCTPDIVSFNTVIKGLALAGKVEAMMDLFYDMKDDSVQPTSVTMLHLFYGITRDNSEGSLLVGNIEALLDCAKEAKLYINRATASYLVNLISKSNNADGVDLCLELLEYVASFGTTLQANVFVTLHPYVTKEGSSAQMERMKGLMARNEIQDLSEITQQKQLNLHDLDTTELVTFVDNNLYEHFSQCETAVSIMRQRGHEVPQNQSENLLRIHLKHHDVEEAQFEFSALKEGNTKPSYELYGLLHEERSNK
uniref:Pentatricopeptide repeat-containing protein n=1 Tax=Vannella robusta TaxID=1487602 RepID=A0A7S4IW75_9EUKA|mmetsp:Transcript_9588/g.11850  ORF Transcript_9588/g.11850 Transcript_9588/m.11850 type:complete len:432 (+) Transcript_9588:138-1433(+)